MCKDVRSFLFLSKGIVHDVYSNNTITTLRFAGFGDAVNREHPTQVSVRRGPLPLASEQCSPRTFLAYRLLPSAFPLTPPALSSLFSSEVERTTLFLNQLEPAHEVRCDFPYLGYVPFLTARSYVYPTIGGTSNYPRGPCYIVMELGAKIGSTSDVCSGLS